MTEDQQPQWPDPQPDPAVQPSHEGAEVVIPDEVDDPAPGEGAGPLEGMGEGDGT